jgi:hypothetical protein
VGSTGDGHAPPDGAYQDSHFAGAHSQASDLHAAGGPRDAGPSVPDQHTCGQTLPYHRSDSGAIGNPCPLGDHHSNDVGDLAS